MIYLNTITYISCLNASVSMSKHYNNFAFMQNGAKQKNTPSSVQCPVSFRTTYFLASCVLTKRYYFHWSIFMS